VAVTLDKVHASKLDSYTLESSQKILLEKIPLIIAQFQQKKGQWISSNCQHIQEGKVHYYGIHKNQQMQVKENPQLSYLATRKLYQEIKSHILQIMGLPPNTKVIQVVGDSAAFSIGGTEKAKEFLKINLPENSVVLYGYTGHAENDGTRCVNAAVTDVINEKNIQDQVIANLVGFHTPIALKQWGCSGPELKHYVIVYGDDESCREHGTVFGDDVVSSDFFADTLLMLDGGAQSFRQACHSLLLDQEIIILPGSRAPSKAFAKETFQELASEVKTPYFNASRFIQEVITAISEKDKSNYENYLNDWYKNYFGRGKCYIGDPKRGDFDTKQKLMDDAWKLFIEEKLYLKIKIFSNSKL